MKRASGKGWRAASVPEAVGDRFQRGEQGEQREAARDARDRLRGRVEADEMCAFDQVEGKNASGQLM